MIKKFIHKIYVITGQIFNLICRCWWDIRDKVCLPKQDAILFVAHPDDDALFFHTFIKEKKPYVVLLTDGWSLIRFKDFKKAMKHYGVKYRAYGLHSRDKRVSLLEKYIKKSFNLGNFKLCVTHNAEGEYGHEMHIRVHNAVKKNINCNLLVPALDSDIENYPLENEEVAQKTQMFNTFYKTELFVLEQYKQWVVNEKLIEVE